MHYLTNRRVPVDLLLRLEGLRGEGPPAPSELRATVDVIKDLASALHYAQRDVFNLQHDLDKLKLENEFLLRQIEEQGEV